MKNYTNKEIINDAFAGKRIETIPKFLVGPGYMAVHGGANPTEYTKNPEVFAKTTVEYGRKHGISIYYTGALLDVTAQMGAGLINRDGESSKNGEETIQTIDDINKLNEYSVENSLMLKGSIAKIKACKKYDPNTPTLAVIHNTPMVVSELMGASVYYKSLLRKKDFVKQLSDIVEPVLFRGIEKFAEAGCDIIWLPMPTMGGTCISKKMYVENCHEYSERIVKKVHEMGMKAVIHTCGNWNDRFDVVFEEGIDGIHLSEANLSEFAKKYGKNTLVIGNIPVVDTLLYKNAEQVYEDTYKACKDACKYGNYVLSPDCLLPPTIPVENVHAMYKAADDAARELFG